MGLLDLFRLRDSAGDTDLREENRALYGDMELLTERLADLELALEDVNWIRMGMENEREFSREGLDRIIQLSRYMYLKNPLVNRACEVQRLYVFGQGVSLRAKDDDVNELVQDFLKANKSEFQQSEMGQKDIELQVTGNLFTVLFPNISTGEVKVRSIPVEEIRAIVTNPDDGNEPWFYHRTWKDARGRQMEALYPDFEYAPLAKPTYYDVNGRTLSVDWTKRVHHVKVGGFRHMRFGIPETYSGLDWARAYKEFLEDWATITRAYAKFAWKATTDGGKRGIAQMKSKLGTTVTDSSGETNPLGTAGFAIMGPGKDLQPMRTAGATTSAEDGRRMLLMVAAGSGLPETYFGDASVGSLATAESLDRPTQLKMVDRQSLWGDYFDDLLQYAIDRAMAAVNGPLPAAIDDEQRHLDIDWPPVLERSLDKTITAITTAATLNGRTPAGTMDLPTISRLLLTALGQDDVDEILEALFPEGWEAARAAADEEKQRRALELARARQLSTQGATEPQDQEAQESTFVEAVKTLRDAVADLARE